MEDIRTWLGFIMMVIGGVGFVILFLKGLVDYFQAPPAPSITVDTPLADLISKLDQRYIAAATLVFLGYMLFDPAGFPGLTGGGGDGS